MIRKQEPAAWPFVVALVLLFTWCITAPREWQRSIRATESSQTLPRQALGSKSEVHRTTTPVITLPLDVFRPTDQLAVALPVKTAGTIRDGKRSHASSMPLLPEIEATSPAPTPMLASEEPNENLQNALSDDPPAPRATEETDSITHVVDQAQAAADVAPRRITRINREYSNLRGNHKPSVPQRHNVWGEPTVLLDELDRLAAECDSGEWATRVGDVVRDLVRTDDLQSPRTSLALKRLRDLVDAKHHLVAVSSSAPHAGELRRLRYAVVRRLDLWELVPELADSRAIAKRAGRGKTVSLSSESSLRPEPQPRIEKLLDDLERFEQSGLTDDGREVAADVLHLAAHDEKLAARTHRWLEWNYRNSNVRLVVARELLNRLVPVPPAVEEPVHDRILGIPTRGWSSSTVQLSVRLIPDPRQIRIALEAKGVVFARVASRRDPVTVYSNSDSAFLARKQFVLSPEGLKAWPTEAEVSNNSRLRGIETDYDDVPLLGSIVEGIARAKHAESERAVRSVARRKITTRVQEDFDKALDPKLAAARQLYQQRVVVPLAGLSLEPFVIEMQSTEARLTSRLRLASDEQLAASTPRPMALSDSLASVQIHQSLVNNVCDRLDLDGRTFTLPELQKRLLEAFKLRPETLSEEYPSDLRVTFAKRDPLTVRFDQGQIELTLLVAELHKYPKTWRDFQVRVFYRPRVTGLDVRFVRDGTVQLRSERFGRELQVVLRGIFNKVFSHDRELVFLEPSLLADPRVAGLGITQCALTDGWLGLSLGSASARQARRTVSPLY